MRLATKSRRGPHAPLGHNAPKELKQEIEAKLGQVERIHYEPRLLAPEDNRLQQRAESGSSDYLYRMKALDAIRDTDFPFRELGGTPAAVTGKRFRTWLLQLQSSHCMLGDGRSALVDAVLDGYNKARHSAEVFGEAEFVKYRDALGELASMVKSRSSTLSQHHQSAAKDLTGSTAAADEPASASSSSSSTYLTSGLQQRSKKPRHFLELKNFKDNYNTLDSTL
ncbi:protein C1orf43 homolog isoform X2 [Kryptolebias marmoratus]|nr:protein C1orf43 homolog isoform X2 [Kryptolebias marmoratus]